MVLISITELNIFVSLPADDFFLIYSSRKMDNICMKWETFVRVRDFYDQMKKDMQKIPSYSEIPRYSEISPSSAPPEYPEHSTVTHSPVTHSPMATRH